MGSPVSSIHGVHHHGVGQPPSPAAHVLLQFRVIPRGLFPHRDLQQRVSQHDRQPRPPLHRMGQPSQTASPRPHHQAFQQNGAEPRSFRPQVPSRRPSA